MASPTGCGSGESCCPVCCHCFAPLCIAANGEYLSQGDCAASCGPGSSCYKNYQTGCWDCLKQTVVVEDTCRDPSNIRGNPECDHAGFSFIAEALQLYRGGLTMIPMMGGVFSNERMLLKTSEGDEGYIITERGSVKDFSSGTLADPTVTVTTDRETLRYVAGERMTIRQAISGGRIRIEGNDFGSGLKFGIYNFMYGVYDFFDRSPEFVEPGAGPEYPQEYAGAMSESGAAAATGPAAAPASGEPMTPDAGYFGSDAYPS
jgi:hypothetical protein